jgi:hypothetical protein
MAAGGEICKNLGLAAAGNFDAGQFNRGSIMDQS